MAKKRGQNEGTIVQRADGTWMAGISLGMNGKRKWFYAKTRAEVAKKMIEAQQKLAQGLNVAPERQTVKQYMNQWFEDVCKPRTRQKTQHSYRQMMDLHILPSLGKHQLADLRPQQVQAFMNAKLKEGLSPRTVCYLKAILRTALNQAVKWDLVVRNAAALTDSPRVERHNFRVLSPEDAQKLMLAMKGHRFETLLTMTTVTGLRLGEVLGLKWQDIDFENQTLRISRQVQHVPGQGFQFVELKTDRSRRIINLPAFLMPYFNQQRKDNATKKLLTKPERWQEHDLMFPSEVGTPLEPRNIRRSLSELLTAAGLDHLRFHDLRHTCATLLLAKSVEPRVIMEILGHSQISLTMNTYCHVLPAVRKDAADKMNSHFEQTGTA